MGKWGGMFEPRGKKRKFWKIGLGVAVSLAAILLARMVFFQAPGQPLPNPDASPRATLTAMEAQLSDQVKSLRAQADQAAHLRARLSEAEDALEARTAEYREIQDQAGTLRRRLAAVEAERNERARAARQLAARTKTFGPIIFAPGSTSLDARARGLAAKAAKAYRAMAPARVRVDAYADPQPLSAHNQARFGDNLGLALVRAVNTARQLFEMGVPRDRVQVSGYGQPPPKNPDSDIPEPDHTRWVLIKVSPYQR